MQLVQRIIPESSTHPTEVDFAWIAGIFEGEGTIKFSGVNSVSLCVQMIDEDVIRKLGALSGKGTIRGPYLYAGGKPLWRWAADTADDVEFLLDRMLPHFGKRRGARAVEGLVRLSHCRRGALELGGVCIHGHEMTVDSLHINATGYRCCRVCRRLGQRGLARGAA